MHMRLIGIFVLSLVATPAFAAGSFSDVPENHPSFEAIEALKQAGIISGYADGTFKPTKAVNRAEALKIILAPLIPKDQLSQVNITPFTDIPAGAWYLPYVEWGRQVFKIVEGPPAKTKFEGERTVILAEFLKLSQLANGVDPASAYGNITLPLSNDVTNPKEWYYPYVRYGLSSSMIGVNQAGKLNPAYQLTRADTAQILYNLLAYKQKARTQNLLNASEQNMLIILQAWNEGVIDEAEFAGARALLSAYGALASSPDDAVTKGAVKVAEAFSALVKGYRAGAEKNYPQVEQFAKEAFSLSDAAIAQHVQMKPLADQIKAIASAMAQSARQLSGQ